MTILDVIRLLRRSWLSVAIGLLIGLVIAAAYTLTRPTTYVAESRGVVVAGSTISVGDTMSGDTVTVSRASMYASLVNSSAVAQRANRTLASQGITRDGEVTATANQGEPFVYIRAEGPTARDAQALANATLSSLRSEALRLETFGRTQGQELPEEELRRMTSINVLPYQPASLPSSPERPGLIRNLILGGTAGAILGGLIAFARRALDARIRSQEQVELLTGKAVLGVIPETKSLKIRKGQASKRVSGAAGEALRQLRTNLRFVSVDAPPRSVVVTSPAPGDGKSTVAAQLARLLAVAGQPVVLIDCDLRRPTQGDQFNVDSAVGVTQVLAGDVSLEDALVESGTRGLQILPAGRIPPNPSELVGSNAMHTLIERLAANHMVIIDAPPVLAVTDGALLSAAADGTILVTRLGRTHRAALEQSAKLLDQTKARVLGVVLNAASKRSLTDGAYSYTGYTGYYKDYYAAAEPETTSSEQLQPADLVTEGEPTSSRAARKRRRGKNTVV